MKIFAYIYGTIFLLFLNITKGTIHGKFDKRRMNKTKIFS